MTPARFGIGLALLWALFAACVYVPDIGRGFVKDDFAWVMSGARAAERPLAVFTADSSGNFYRPIVTLSFAADFAVHRLNARGYGFTNLLLYAACALLMFVLFRDLGMTAAGASAGAFAWAVNPSGVDMAVLWLSGRTSLLMTLSSIVAVILFVRGRRFGGAVCLLAALLCKEDAVTVPAIVLAAVRVRAPNESHARTAQNVAIFALVEAVYFLVRASTHAMTPASAPEFYRLEWNPLSIIVNGAHYADRAGTAMAALAVLAIVAYRARPRFSPEDHRRFALAAFWFLAALPITARVPVRSSLYAVFPSIGFALALGTFVEGLRRSSTIRFADLQLQAAFAVVLLLLIPAYHVRNDRFVEPARVSNRTMAALAGHRGALPQTGTIVFVDEPDRFSNFTNAFGGAETVAVRLYTNRELSATVVSAEDRRHVAGEVMRVRLTHGRVTLGG